MPPFTLALVLIVLSNVLYHVSQKSISPKAPPLLSLLVTYGISAANVMGVLLCVAGLFLALR